MQFVPICELYVYPNSLWHFIMSVNIIIYFLFFMSDENQDILLDVATIDCNNTTSLDYNRSI